MRRVASWAEPGLAHDLDVAGGVQQVGQAAADDLVVVEQEDTDHVSFLPGPVGAT